MDESHGAIFRDSVEQSVSGTESRRMTFVGDEEEWSGGERAERQAAASPEREAQLSLFLYTGRGRRHETPPRSLVT